MNWTISATGTPDTVKDTLDQQFAALRKPDLPLAALETLVHVEGTIRQYVENLDPAEPISVEAGEENGTLQIQIW